MDNGQYSLGHYMKFVDFNKLQWKDIILLRLMAPYSYLEAWVDNADGGRFVSNLGIQYVGAFCRHLTSIHLEFCQITSSFLQTLGQDCPQLCEFKVRFTYGPYHLPYGVFAMLRGCSSLKQLSFHKYCFEPWTDNMVEDLTFLSCLTHLKISIPPGQSFFTAINEIESWPHLLDLNIYDDTSTENDFIRFIRHHRHLKSLHLHGGIVTDCSLEAMAFLLPHLVDVAIDWNSSTMFCDGVHQLVRRCLFLTRVALFSEVSLFNVFPEAALWYRDIDRDTQPYFIYHMYQRHFNKIRQNTVYA